MPQGDSPTHGDGDFPRAQQIGPPSTPLSSLPDDDDQALNRGDYQEIATFRASIRGSRITVAGETIISLGVPFEWKYDALPVTDVRGIQLQIVVSKPIMGGGDGSRGNAVGLHSGAGDNNGAGSTGSNSNGSGMADILPPELWLDDTVSDEWW